MRRKYFFPSEKVKRRRLIARGETELELREEASRLDGIDITVIDLKVTRSRPLTLTFKGAAPEPFKGPFPPVEQY